MAIPVSDQIKINRMSFDEKEDAREETKTQYLEALEAFNSDPLNNVKYKKWQYLNDYLLALFNGDYWAKNKFTNK